MKLQIKKGTTSKRIAIFIQDTSLTTGAGLTGLVFSNVSWFYWREDEGNANATSVTLQTATRGTFASGGFIEKDATNLPGWYEIGIPDAALATGAGWVGMMLKGGTNMSPVPLEIELVTNVESDVVALLPAALVGGRMDSSSGAMAAGVITNAAFAANAISDAKVDADVTIASVTGAVGSVTGAVGSVTTVSDKTGYRLSATGVDDVLDEVVEGSYTLRQLVRIIVAGIAGKASGLETATAVYRDTGDSKDRITATTTSDGNRTAVTLDAS